jgi:RND family efflux transporter MFP subunit
MNNTVAQKWLDILCRTLPDAHSAMFTVLDNVSKTIRPLAKWPENLNDFADFTPIVNTALQKNGQVCVPNVQQPDQQHYDYFALPVFIQSELLGIIVIKIGHLPAEHHEDVFKALQQGSEWLGLAQFRRGQNDDFYASVVSLLAACYEQNSYHEALIRLVTELTLTLNCDRVAIGEFQRHHTKVVALSNSAQFDVRSNLMQKIAGAMDEAIEQDSVIVFPNPQATAIQRAHQDLARQFGSGSLLSIPLIFGEDIFGAITLLRSEDKPFDRETTRLCEQTMSLIIPFLALKKADGQALSTRIAKTVKNRLTNLLGFKNLKIKLAAASVAILMLAAGLLEGDFHVTADAVLEGKLQRVVAAPVSGHLLSASVRAGDTVRRGDNMASLDDSELQLELNKLSGQLQKFRREYRVALSTSDLVKVRVISAQIDQATAEMELTQQQLQKIVLTAPFDGFVIEGDLSQMLGSPVERGDTLFKIAPLEGYRIILKVDERLISYVREEQKGTLALSSMPERKFQLSVQKIIAVAKADDGKNIFRVEASLDNAPGLLRPGMEGIGKINAGRARLLWIWTHELVDWLRLWFWSWWF